MHVNSSLEMSENNKTTIYEESIDAIRNSKEQWQSIIDAVSDYIFVIDDNLVIRRSNMAFAMRFHKHPREIIGLKINELMDKSTFIEHMPDDISNESHCSKEVMIGDNTFLLNVYPARYGDDKVFIYTLKDITEMLNLKNKLYCLHSIALLGKLVSGVTHEINNPLTGILGYSEMLSMQVKDNAIKRQITEIYKAAEKCKNIIESIVNFSSVNSGIVDINDAVNKAIEMRSYWIKKNGIEFLKDLGNIPILYGSSHQIQQMILNILMNSEDAIAEGKVKGKIIVKTAYDMQANNIIIKISDNGIGILEEYIPKIFEPFFTTKKDRIGLGLSIAHEIASSYKGTIKVQSKAGQGSVFFIELPNNIQTQQ